MRIPPIKSTKFWKDIPTACFGASAAGFLCHHFWYVHFQLHSPREPDVRNGLIYPFEVKGHPVYVSASDKNLSAITFILATGFLFLFLGAASRTLRSRLQDRQFPFDQGLALLVSFSLMMALYLVFGRSIADMLVSNGIVLIWS